MKKRTKIILQAIAMILLFLSIYTCSNKQSPESDITIAENNSYITSPPLPHLDIAYQKFSIDPAIPNTLRSSSGAVLNIPANAFLDVNGDLVNTHVELAFRDFYHPLEFYLAGVPMTYNDNGEEKVFESAGMVELNASADGHELFVNPAQIISVDLISWSKSPEFNLYDLDQATGLWVDQGKDSISVSEKAAELEQLPPIPAMPKVATPYSFKIKDDTNNFPEIDIYERVLFDPVNPSKCGVSNATEMRINLLDSGIFEVISIIDAFGKYQESRCLCYLAFEQGEDYDSALEIYQAKYASLLSERKALADDISLQWDEYQDILDQHRKAPIKSLSGKEKIIRTLSMNKFGFVNCDYPLSYPQGGLLTPYFVDEEQNPITLNEVVLVEQNTNALFRYTSTIKYNPDNENVMWGLTPDNKLAYFKKEDFDLLSKSSKKQTVTMHISEKELLSYEDIMKVLF